MRTRRKVLSRDQVSIAGEADYIIGKAQERDARVVTLGSIVLFSTNTGDAWMLDSEDGLALCLAQNGEKQNDMVLDTNSNFQIAWSAQYEIQDNVFTVVAADGHARSIIGYPTDEIRRASGRVR